MCWYLIWNHQPDYDSRHRWLCHGNSPPANWSFCGDHCPLSGMDLKTRPWCELWSRTIDPHLPQIYNENMWVNISSTMLRIWVLFCWQETIISMYRWTPQHLPVFIMFHPYGWNLVGGLEHFLFFHILRIIIPIDFHIFQRGWNHQPDMFFPYLSTTRPLHGWLRPPHPCPEVSGRRHGIGVYTNAKVLRWRCHTTPYDAL